MARKINNGQSTHFTIDYHETERKETYRPDSEKDTQTPVTLRGHLTTERHVEKEKVFPPESGVK